MQTKRVLAGVLTSTLLLGTCPTALAATENYNDSSLTGGSAAWQAWTEAWVHWLRDYTQVSMTPGAGRNRAELRVVQQGCRRRGDTGRTPLARTAMR